MICKKLAIITDCVHLFDAKGHPSTENHIFRKQMEALANKFEETLICCPFEHYSIEKVLSQYSNKSIHFHPLPQVGGNTLADKIQLLKAFPSWFKAFKTAYDFADVVYQRFPNNLNLPGFFYFYFKRSKVFATYTGTWKNYATEPFTYRIQKWLLKYFFRGPVGAYIDGAEVTKKIFKSGSPSYSNAEWDEEIIQLQDRIKRNESGVNFIPVFITVGALVPNKNQQYILEAFAQLQKNGFCYQLHIVGDGPLREKYAHFIDIHGMSESVFLEGKKTDKQLRELYRASDFLIQAPKVEGFGKVPMEAFFHGVIPLISNVAMAKEMIGESKSGFLFELGNLATLTHSIEKVTIQKGIFSPMITSGRAYAKNHLLENWADLYHQKLISYFD